MNPRLLLLPLLALASLTLQAATAANDHLVTHLDVDRVEITTRFQGQRILLFGAVPTGTDVIIKMVSPTQEVTLSRKSRFGPLWLEAEQMTVHGAPELLYLIASHPLGQLLTPAQLKTFSLTLDSALDTALTTGDSTRMDDWQKAFLRLKQAHGRYLIADDAVRLENNRLFYAHMDLPAESPLGRYRLSIFLVRDGEVIRRQEEYLEVREVSLESWISQVVHNAPWSFGFSFTLGIMALGFALGVVMRPAREA